MRTRQLIVCLLAATAAACEGSSGGSVEPETDPGPPACDVPHNVAPAPTNAWPGQLYVRVDAPAQVNAARVFVNRFPTIAPVDWQLGIAWVGAIVGSPDGTLLAMRAENNTTQLIDDAGLDLASFEGAGAYAWSNDSRYVWYDEPAIALYEVDVTTFSRRKLVTTTSGFDTGLVLSPDRSTMVWSHRDGNVLRVFKASVTQAPVDGSAGTLLFESIAGSPGEQGTVFLGDERVLLALDDADGGGIFTIDVASGAAERVILAPELVDFALSHDQSRVAYTTREGVFVADVTSWTPLAIDCSGDENGGLTWAPNDLYVAFFRRDSTPQLRTIEVSIAAADGSGSWSVFSVDSDGDSTIDLPAGLIREISQAIAWGS